MEIIARPDTGPSHGRRRITRNGILCAALLSLSAMTGCLGNCSVRPDKGCYPGNYQASSESPSSASRAMDWTSMFDRHISTLLAQHHYQEALRSFDRLAQMYNVLDYHDAGAEPLYKRALTTLEGANGPENPYVAQSLENYAVLLRETGRGLRDAEAADMEARAKAIWAKHPEANRVQ